MNRVYRPSHSAVLLGLVVIGLFLAMAGRANAQAWVPQRGQGSITLSFQTISNTGHRLRDGTIRLRARSQNISLYFEADYAVTDRLSFTVGLPYVFGRYTDPLPPPGTIPFVPSDECRCWQSGPQDFGFTARYNVLRSAAGTFSLTPSMSVGQPSHNYEFRAESALGRNLKEVTIAVDAGKRLDAISPNLHVQGRYSYTFVERVLDDISVNRSNASVEGAYRMLKGRLAVRGIAAWQRTHGGLRFGIPLDPHNCSALECPMVVPSEINTPERLAQFDRLIQDNYSHTGGGFSYAFPRMDVFASYIAYVGGAQTHAGRALTVGISFPFEFHPHDH
jgi:hypothetical protein